MVSARACSSAGWVNACMFANAARRKQTSGGGHKAAGTAADGGQDWRAGASREPWGRRLTADVLAQEVGAQSAQVDEAALHLQTEDRDERVSL
jgi:hypothetical protein